MTLKNNRHLLSQWGTYALGLSILNYIQAFSVLFLSFPQSSDGWTDGETDTIPLSGLQWLNMDIKCDYPSCFYLVLCLSNYPCLVCLTLRNNRILPLIILSTMFDDPSLVSTIFIWATEHWQMDKHVEILIDRYAHLSGLNMWIRFNYPSLISSVSILFYAY